MCMIVILNLLWSEFVETMSDVSICFCRSWSRIVCLWLCVHVGISLAADQICKCCRTKSPYVRTNHHLHTQTCSYWKFICWPTFRSTTRLLCYLSLGSCHGHQDTTCHSTSACQITVLLPGIGWQNMDWKVFVLCENLTRKCPNWFALILSYVKGTDAESRSKLPAEKLGGCAFGEVDDHCRLCCAMLLWLISRLFGNRIGRMVRPVYSYNMPLTQVLSFSKPENSLVVPHLRYTKLDWKHWIARDTHYWCLVNYFCDSMCVSMSSYA